MKRTTLLLKSLLLAVGLLAGASASWAESSVYNGSIYDYDVVFGTPNDPTTPTGINVATEFTVDNGEQEQTTMTLSMSGSVLAGNQAGGRTYSFTNAPTEGTVTFKATGKFVGGNYDFFHIQGIKEEGGEESSYNIVSSPYALPSASGGTTVLRIFGQNITASYVYTPRNVLYGFDVTIDLDNQSVSYTVTYASKGSSGTVSQMSTVSGTVAVPDGITLKSVTGLNIPRCGSSGNNYYDNVAFYSAVPNVATYSYSVKAKSGNTVLKELSSGSNFKGESVTYYWPAVLNVNGVLYTAPAVSSAYKGSFTLDSDNKEININYTASETVKNLVFLAEAEDLFTVGTGSAADSRCSMGKGGYCSSKTAFVTLPAGTYYLVLSNRCSGNRTGIHKFYKGNEAEPFFSADGNGYNAQRESGEFVLNEETTIYMSGGDNNQYVDYLYIYGTPTNDIVGALDNSTSFMAAHKDVTINKGQVVKFNFKNHGNGSENWYNWLLRMSGTSGVDHTLRADNYVIGDDGSTVSKRNITEDGGAINWSDFVADMTDADVEMTVTYAADGRFFVEATSTGAAHTYVHSFSYNEPKTGGILLELGVEKAWLDVTDIQYTINIGSTGWATLYTTSALDFTKTGLTAYTATVKPTDPTVELAPVTDVPANTGVVLMGEEGSYTIPVIASSETEQGELLGSATEATACPAANGTYYVLAKVTDGVQFNPAVSGSIAAGKAYLYVESGDKARALNVVFAGETTAIDAIANVKEQIGEVYNLAGQRVAKPAKGLYIVSGKKVMFK